jgi:hypothetical protein
MGFDPEKLSCLNCSSDCWDVAAVVLAARHIYLRRKKNRLAAPM